MEGPDTFLPLDHEDAGGCPDACAVVDGAGSVLVAGLPTALDCVDGPELLALFVLHAEHDEIGLGRVGVVVGFLEGALGVCDRFGRGNEGFQGGVGFLFLRLGRGFAVYYGDGGGVALESRDNLLGGAALGYGHEVEDIAACVAGVATPLPLAVLVMDGAGGIVVVVLRGGTGIFVCPEDAAQV